MKVLNCFVYWEGSLKVLDQQVGLHALSSAELCCCYVAVLHIPFAWRSGPGLRFKTGGLLGLTGLRNRRVGCRFRLVALAVVVIRLTGADIVVGRKERY